MEAISIFLLFLINAQVVELYIMFQLEIIGSEKQTISFYWTYLSRSVLKSETAASLRNVLFLN
jgi:hypothetical protein